MQSGRVKSEIYECKVHNGSRVYVMCVCGCERESEWKPARANFRSDKK